MYIFSYQHHIHFKLDNNVNFHHLCDDMISEALAETVWGRLGFWLRMPDCRSCHIASPAALTLAIHCFCLSLQPCLATKQTAFHKDQQIKHVWIRHESRVCVRDFEIKGVPESSRASVYFELRVQREGFLTDSE